MGFWGEAIACFPQEPRTFWLGSHPAATPRLALRRLLTRAEHISRQLDPPASRPLRHWLTDAQAHEHALAALTAGRMFTHTVPDDALRYMLSARPATPTRLPRQVP
ncbi:hypothetical protein [Streptomyces aidingensis]|uniref:Uncharacterized protein n=1 Tax=Streptomyces aidingensis TaxID=910347 RepID=A0A1I1UGH4_9ACTN|nr:hypothetical protein [Streptomyces aidingensis]SFD69869.1 hypothetical protein SAMN05421773_12443 [Streptomyces aidingensis]